MLQEEATDLVDHSCPLPNQTATDTMECLQIELIHHRHESHSRSLNRLCNRFRITVIILVAFEERLHILRRNQSDFMAECGKLPAYVVRTRTRFHADQSAGQVSQRAPQLASRSPIAETDSPSRI